MLQNTFVHRMTKVLVDVMFYVGVLCCLTVPIWVKGIRDLFGYTDNILLPFMLILFSSGVCSVYILFQLKRLFYTILGGNSFVDANVSCFRKMAVASFLISLIYIGKMTFWPTPATALIILVFALAGLFCFTLKDVFKQAVAYKEENDLTV